jgi:hypothetical protein
MGSQQYSAANGVRPGKALGAHGVRRVLPGLPDGDLSPFFWHDPELFSDEERGCLETLGRQVFGQIVQRLAKDAADPT